MIGELNFKNLIVKYDASEISKQKIRLIKGIDILTILICMLVILAGLFSFPNIPNDNIVAFGLGFTIFASVMVAILVMITNRIESKLEPRHYRFVTWLMRLKGSNIEVGFFNGKYLVIINDPSHHTQMYDLNKFLGCSISVVDESSGELPIVMNIDVTNYNPIITIKDDLNYVKAKSKEDCSMSF